MPAVPSISAFALPAQESPDNAQGGRPKLGTDKLVQKICSLVEHEIRHHHAQLSPELVEDLPMASQCSSEKATPTPVVNSEEKRHSNFPAKPKPSTSGRSNLSQAGRITALFQSSIAPNLQILHDTQDLPLSEQGSVPLSVRKTHMTHAERDNMMRLRAQSGICKLSQGSLTAFATKQGDGAITLVSAKLASVTRKRVAHVIKSKEFDHFCGLIILANAITIGVSINMMVSSESPSYSPWMQVVSCCFTICFTLELIARIHVHGLEFFKGVEKGWNLFDLVVVLVAFMDMIFQLFFRGGEIERSLGVISVLRSFRAFRIVRLMRTFRALRPLRLLLSGIVGTLSHCCWALILLTLIIYLFGVTFTHAAVLYLYSEDRDLSSESELESLRRETLEDLFGSLLRSMNTLFQSICGGMNWDKVIETLQVIPTSGSFYIAGFLIYIGFVYLGMLNVLTALFCQQAVENAMGDQEVVLEGKLAAMRQMEDKLRTIFRELDDLNQSDDSPEGMFTFAELEKFMEDRRIIAQFALLGIVPEDAWTLFKLLDPEENNLVDTDSFISGCMRLRGEATRMDVASLASHTRSLEALMMDFVQDFDAITQSATSADLRLSSKEDPPSPKLQLDSQGFRKQRMSVSQKMSGRTLTQDSPNTPQNEDSKPGISVSGVDEYFV